MDEQQPTNKEIMEAITGLKDDVSGLKDEIADVRETIHAFATHVDETFATKQDLLASEARTRDFIERRVSDVEEQLVKPMKAIDAKDSALVDVAKSKNIISANEATKIAAMSPFSA